MRCLACNRLLSDRDTSRKSITTGEYLDLCGKCFDTIKEQVPVIENPLLEGEDNGSSDDDVPEDQSV